MKEIYLADILAKYPCFNTITAKDMLDVLAAMKESVDMALDLAAEGVKIHLGKPNAYKVFGRVSVDKQSILNLKNRIV